MNGQQTRANHGLQRLRKKMEDLWLVDKLIGHETYTAKYETVFLLSDWLFSLWHGINPGITF